MRTVFVDVDTQIDFMFPAGALYVPGAELVVPAIRQLNAYAAQQGIPLLSTTDAHLEDDPEFQRWPPHCVAGTAGQIKVSGTALAEYLVLPAEEALIPAELPPQIIVQKRSVDVFTNPNLPALLARLNADEYVVYGVVTEICVANAARGLLATGKPVRLVTDAIQALRPEDSERTLQDLTAAGATLTTVNQIR